ncbi:MAG: hypothetical protein NTY41_07140 [Proteobacteria bacterium]|nr:hypothetical protein [Pseudomonadota bacterium]
MMTKIAGQLRPQHLRRPLGHPILQLASIIETMSQATGFFTYHRWSSGENMLLNIKKLLFCTLLFASGHALATNFLLPNTMLTANQVLTAANGKYNLVMQSDGNLVLSRFDSVVRFATMKFGNGNFSVMQGDGNFVEYSASSQALWDTHTQGYSGAWLNVQDDGNLVGRIQV